MKNRASYLFKLSLIIFLLLVKVSNSQEINPEITIRVDTSQTNIGKIYNLYKDYLNSEMDSIYANPYWDLRNWKKEDGLCDRSAFLLLSDYEPNDFLRLFPPKILQIDSVDNGRYQIKILFALKCPSEGYLGQTPTAITKLYGVRQNNSEFKLENLISYDTRSWQHAEYGFINYIVSPSVKFDTVRACEANEFYRKVAAQFSIEKIPKIDFYLTSHSDELMELFNFEYALSYHSGLTLKFRNEIYSSLGDPLYKHELVHMLLSGKIMIINEGVATWLAGPGGGETYEAALTQVSIQFKNRRPKSLQEIMDFTYRNQFDNKILYVTGAVICQMAYEEKGIEGIQTLLNCEKETFKETMEAIFCKPFFEIEQSILNFIVNFK